MSEQRKPLVSHIFTADPSAHVFKGKIYVYPSHDIPHDGEDNDDGDEYLMEDYPIKVLRTVGFSNKNKVKNYMKTTKNNEELELHKTNRARIFLFYPSFNTAAMKAMHTWQSRFFLPNLKI